MPAVPEHLTAKYHVVQSFSNNVDESSLLGLDPDEKLELHDRGFIIPNSTSTSTKRIIEITTKSYVENLLENSRNRRDLLSVFNDQRKKFENNKLTS